MNTQKKHQIVSIESINPQKLSFKDFEKIGMLEQDMRSRRESFGEYVECEDCGKIHTKDDFYSELSNDIRQLIVSKIEEIIPFDTLSCHVCQGRVHHIHPVQETLYGMVQRYYQMMDSFLVVGRDEDGEIRGFFDGFIDTYGKIYDYEFARCYKNIGSRKIAGYIDNRINISKPLLTIHASGMEEKFLNMLKLVEMQKKFFQTVQEKYAEIDGIYEVRVGTSVSIINALFGATKLDIVAQSGEQLTNTNVIRDIYVHRGMANDILQRLEIPFTKTFRANIHLFRDVGVAA